MWRFAAITPQEISTSPAGPTNLHPAVPSISPDSLINALIPNDLASVKETSTWDWARVGPKIDIFVSPFGPITVTFSWQANCPGCDKSFLFVKTYPLPNKVSKSACDKCTCLAEVSTKIVFPIKYPPITYLSYNFFVCLQRNLFLFDKKYEVHKMKI